ncbi:urease accessory protein UreD [Sorangium sp. So ce1151]|uniref:urease accessory protein UreD n=1 Tax=Sorangium sp. So ce1151 TaxID=3133332 RepID=UPI003F619772
MADPTDYPEHLLGLRRDNGFLEVRFERHGRTRPVHLAHRAPCRMLFPKQEPDEPLLGVFITTSGGMASGDVLRVAVEAGRGATATVTSQAAEKIYPSLGAPSRIALGLRVEEGAALEWLPQETILFDNAHFERRVELDVAPGGSLLALDIVVFGRLARGERFSAGALHDVWRVRRGGRLTWADALSLSGDIAAQIAAPAGFGGATAAGLVLLVADDAAAWVDEARARLAGGSSRAGVTLVGGALVARALGAEPAQVRRDLTALVSWLRAARSGHPARMPRFWSI